MIYQNRRFTCGPASLHNAVNWVKPEGTPSEDEFKEACKASDNEGTSEHHLKRALRKFEVPHSSFSASSVRKACATLQASYARGKAIVLYGHRRVHWFTTIGMAGPYYIIVDSADEDLVLRWDLSRLLDEWGGDFKRYYGIVVG